jgi:hypothetical protein
MVWWFAAMEAIPLKGTAKMLGDAGEHYAVSQFTFSGRPATKMPDGWESYDLAVETGTNLVRVSVKTRSESQGWRTSKWFNFDDRRACDWMVFVFLPREGPVRAWVVPFGVVKSQANVPGAGRKDPHFRDVSWKDLTKGALAKYENNWTLVP